MNRFVVFSYNADEQEHYADFIRAETAEAAEEYISKLRPYDVACDAWSVEHLANMLHRLKTDTAEEIEAGLEQVAEDSDVGICRTCRNVYDLYGDGYDGECPDCADKRESKREEKQPHATN